MSYDLKQVIVIRKDLKMRAGKMISQGAHASGEFMREQIVAMLDGGEMAFTPDEIAWMRAGMAKITVRTDSPEQFDAIRDHALQLGLKVRIITDSGRTEFGGVPTITALAIGPDRVDVIDKVTGDLTLL
jgi:PTH2 family peptidyl-tRNA hydrolase